MAQVVTQDLKITDTVNETLTFGTATSAIAQAQSIVTLSWANGTAASQIDFHYEHEFTLSSAASTTLTLSALTDDLGRTVAFVKIRKFSIRVTARTGNDFLTCGAAASSPWLAMLGGTTPTFIVRRYFLNVDDGTTGFAVASASSDQLKIVNSGSASMTFVVSVSGTHV